MKRYDNPKELATIGGLRYAGIIVYGEHHGPHHWGTATG
jgi:hypothetical protein